MELLEKRDVPATLYWDPIGPPITDPNTGDVGYFAHTASNWVNESGGRSVTPPGEFDDLYFDGTGDLDETDCIFSTSAGTLFSSIHILDEWSGTVTFQTSVTFGGFEQLDGTIMQDGSSVVTLTVDPTQHIGSPRPAVDFVWTGGILNDADTVGVVRLLGATGDINAGTDGTLVSGSTFILDASSLDFLEGTWVGVGIDVNDGSTFSIGDGEEDGPEQPPQPPPEVPPLVLPLPPKIVKADLVFSTKFIDEFTQLGGVRINEGGTVDIGTNAPNTVVVGTSALWLQNSGGTFTVENGADYQIAGSKQWLVTPDDLKDLSYFQTSGTLSVTHGSQIKFRHGAALRAGSLNTITSAVPANDGTTKNVDPAKIVGNIISWVKIDILKSKAGIFGDLVIDGDFDWRDGELTVKLDGRRPGGNSNSQLATRLHVIKTLKMDTGTNGSPNATVAFAVDNVAGAAAPAAGRTWDKVVKADVQILFQQNGSLAPVQLKLKTAKFRLLENSTTRENQQYLISLASM